MSMVTDVKRAVANQARDLEPDDDILPTLLYRNTAGERTVMGMAVDMDDQTAAFMSASLMIDEAIEAVYSTFIWAVVGKKEDATEDMRWKGVPPSQHPDRVEQAMIAHYTPDGAAVYFADVTRAPGAAPVLGLWVKQGFDRLGGRVDHALRTGIQMSATMPDELRAAYRLARAAGKEAREGAIRGTIGAMTSEEK